MKTTSNNFCSAVVEYKNERNEVRRQSVCSISEAVRYIQEVIIPNNWTFLSMERGFNY